jgi:hypothetical protein
LLRRFAARLSLPFVAEGSDITVVPIGGFGQRQKIEHAAWTFEKVLRSDIAIAAVLDRDYRCSEEIDELVRDARTALPNFHILDRKELENYLLVPQAIGDAIADRLRERGKPRMSIDAVENLIDEMSAAMKSDVLAQRISNRYRYFGNRTSRDPSTVAAEAIAKLDAEWTPLGERMRVVPGKQLLTSINNRLQQDHGISLTLPQIARNLSPGMIAQDLREILHNINRFAGGA